MIDRELKERAATRQRGDLSETVENFDRSEDQYQCSQCRAFGYLSHVVAAEPDTSLINSMDINVAESSAAASTAASTVAERLVACAQHVDSLGPGPKLLRLRFSDPELTAMLGRVQARSAKASNRPGQSMLPPTAPAGQLSPELNSLEPRSSKVRRDTPLG